MVEVMAEIVVGTCRGMGSWRTFVIVAIMERTTVHIATMWPVFYSTGCRAEKRAMISFPGKMGFEPLEIVFPSKKIFILDEMKNVVI